MRRKNVKSSHLVSVGYNRTNKVLEIEFISGGIYQYLDVPKSTHSKLTKSESKGKFFYENIQFKFQFKRIK